MDEQPNLHEFINEVSNFTDESPAAPAKSGAPAKSASPVVSSGSQG